MNSRLLWRKLLLTLGVLGIINVVLAFSFFYYFSTLLIEERTGHQMASVRALASEKLHYYLDHLKNLSLRATSNLNSSFDKNKLNPTVLYSLEGLFIGVGGNLKKVFGDTTPLPEEYLGIKELSLQPYGDKYFILKIPSEKRKFYWIFNNKGINSVLSQREGLGETGEIYLVGEDKKIKSGSRLVKDLTNVIVNNESIRLGKLDKFGVHSIKDYRGVEVVSSYSNFIFDQLRYILLSEIDKKEVFSPLNSLFPKVLILCAILLIFSFGITYLFSKKIIKIIDKAFLQIQDLNFKVINAQEEERRRISLNLHDGIGQILSALRWGLSQTQNWKLSNSEKEKTQEFMALCNDTITEIRNISNDLMPSSLKELGCFSAIKDYLRRQEKYLNTEIKYLYSEQLELLKFREGLDINIFRMVQEFVQNSFKHAEATYMSLVIIKNESNLIIRFEDNGKGMPDDSSMPKTLKNRTELMGGKITRSYASQVMVFQVEIPMENISYA